LAFFEVDFSLGCGTAGSLDGGDAKTSTLYIASYSAATLFRGEEGGDFLKHKK
jgi:hypothetical protein